MNFFSLKKKIKCCCCHHYYYYYRVNSNNRKGQLILYRHTCVHIDLKIQHTHKKNSHKLWFYEAFQWWGVTGHTYIMHVIYITNQKWSTCGWWNEKRSAVHFTPRKVFTLFLPPTTSSSTIISATASSTYPHSLASMNAKKTFFFILASTLNAYRMDGFDLSLLIISPRFCIAQQKYRGKK